MASFGTCLKPSTTSLFHCPNTIFRQDNYRDYHPVGGCRSGGQYGLGFKDHIFKHKRDTHTRLSWRSLAPYKTVGHCEHKGAEDQIIRPSMSHCPSKWDGVLLSPDHQVENYAEAVDALKERVRNMVIDKNSKPEDKMILIDTLERLGVAYHFAQDIEEQIAKIFLFHQEKKDQDDDLFTTALHFRLFRQHGYDAPCSVFSKFKDDDGTFKKTLANDVNGLLSLYEATYVRYSEEVLLNEASIFATYYLKHAMPLLNSCLQERVVRALTHPIHWSLGRLEACHYISIYEKGHSKNDLILKFAKLDFNWLQNLHKEEILEVRKWWKHLDICSKLPHIRNRVVEGYLWGAGVNLESRYSFPRLCAAKTLLLCIILNDTFDSYAPFQEAKKFTDILQQRCDVEQINQLPDGIQITYKAILSTFEEFDRDVKKQGRSYAVSYARESVGRLADSYLKAASWRSGHETPTFLKSISNGTYNSGCHAVVSSYFMGMESVTEEALEWIMSAPLIAEASGQYTRYMNDIASYKREHKAGTLPNTSIDCYMREYSVPKEKAIVNLGELAEDAWMVMNREYVSTTCVPKDCLKPMVNYARVGYLSYWQGSDGLTNPEAGLDNDIATLFIHPIPINSRKGGD